MMPLNRFAFKNEYKFNITTISINCCLVEAAQHGLNQIVQNQNILTLLGKIILKLVFIQTLWKVLRLIIAKVMVVGINIQFDRTESINVYHKFVKKWLSNNIVGVIGGCCGVEPKHIQYMVSKIDTELNNNSRQILKL